MSNPVCKVLLVEDSVEIQDLLRSVVEDEGYDFVAFSSGAEMLATLERGDNFDVAVIDYHLKGSIDGVALARRAAAAGLGVILVSGTGDEGAHDAIRGSGFPYIRKPFRLAALLSAIEEAIETVKRDCERRSRAAK